MSSKQVFFLNNIDPGYHNIILAKVEQAFGISFTQSDIAAIHTFSDLCNAIYIKNQTLHPEACTAQHAFYMLRNTIVTTKGLRRSDITVKTCLKDILTEEETRELFNFIGKDIGVCLKLDNQKTGVLGFISAAFIHNGFASRNLGQLAEKIAREHYIKCRRSVSTPNRNEIDKKIQQLFQHELDLDPSVLTPQASFN